MKHFFKILFWLIGYVYEEGETILVESNGELGDWSYRLIYAHKKTQTKEQGFGDSLLLGKYSRPFLDRWKFYKIVLK